jgi:hypothetical protein
MRTSAQRPVIRLTLAATVFAAAVALAGCGSDTDAQNVTEEVVTEEQSADTMESPSADAAAVAYEGEITDDFIADIDSYLGSTVTLRADIREVQGPSSFIIQDPTDEHNVLVVHDGSVDNAEHGAIVEVTGTLYDASESEQLDEGTPVNPEDEVFADWQSPLYIDAVEVTRVDQDGD